MYLLTVNYSLMIPNEHVTAMLRTYIYIGMRLDVLGREKHVLYLESAKVIAHSKKYLFRVHFIAQSINYMCTKFN